MESTWNMKLGVQVKLFFCRGGRFPGSTIPPFRHKFMFDSAFRRKFLANSDSAICSVNDAILMHFTPFK